MHLHTGTRVFKRLMYLFTKTYVSDKYLEVFVSCVIVYEVHHCIGMRTKFCATLALNKYYIPRYCVG